MEGSKRRGGKSKKVVIGVATVVAVAAVAVPTALTLSGSGNNAGASGANRYSIIVSSTMNEIPEYSLSIDRGTKIAELKSLLKGIDGYTITGIFKDEAMQQEYLDSDIVESDSKIYIQFSESVYTVSIYDEAGTTVLETKEVIHKDSLVLPEPEKAEDGFASYEFVGWVNERGEIVDLNEITTDLNIRPSFKANMKEYQIGFVNSNNLESISVKVGGAPVTLDSTYHYGSVVRIRATQKYGKKITDFKIRVGTEETIDVLSEEYEIKHNGEVLYEIAVVANGDISITYQEVEPEINIGTIPEGVTVTRGGVPVLSDSELKYSDLIEISYNLGEDFTLDKFEVSGAEIVPGTKNTYKVVDNVGITFEKSYIYAYLNFEKVDDGFKVVGLNKDDVRVVVIPNYYSNGEPVTEVGEAAFKDSKITSLTIGENVKRFGNEAFMNCANLRDIYFNAIEADDLAKDLSGSDAIYVKDVFATVGKETKGTNFIFGNSVEVIPSGLFYNEKAVSDETLMTNFGNLKIGNRVREIRPYAFSMSVFSSYVLPNSLEIIGAGAFGISGVKNIVIPDSVTEIGEAAFALSTLESITLSKNITVIRQGTFGLCGNLTSLVIPANVVKIEANICSLSGLTSVTFENTNGWKAGTNSISVYSSYDNARYLKETYKNVEWVRE